MYLQKTRNSTNLLYHKSNKFPVAGSIFYLETGEYFLNTLIKESEAWQIKNLRVMNTSLNSLILNRFSQLLPPHYWQ